MDEFSRHVDGETVRDIVDENGRIECWDEIKGASSDAESSMRWAFYRGNELVGQRGVTNELCGKYGVFYGCDNFELHHDSFDAEGKFVHAEGKVYMKHMKHSCDRYTCSECYRRAAFRESVRAEERLAEASKRYGLCEHIVASVPLRLYHITDGRVLKRLARKILLQVGVVGGCDVFHAFRYSRDEGWYFSPHIHVLGWILGGYKCRKCEKLDFASSSTCVACNGFEKAVREGYYENGWVVKVTREPVTGNADVRRSIRKSISYELAHASIRVGVRNVRVLSWWGVASYSKLKVTRKRIAKLCPLCQHPLKEFRYVGDDSEILGFIKWGVWGAFYDKLIDGKGLPNWVEVPRDRFGRKVG